MAKVDIGANGTFAGSGRSVVRTSTGDLYAVVVDSGGAVEVWYSADGTSWAQQDAGNSPATGIAADCTIDSSDILHICLLYTSPSPRDRS